MDGFGVGVSVKLPDGTMVWIQRDQAAELIQDLEHLPDLLDATKRVRPQPPTPAQAEQAVASQLGPLSADEADRRYQNIHNGAEVGRPQSPAGETGTVTFETCPTHNIPKDRWVPPGFSERTNKKYPGFYGCPTPGCKGK